MDKRKIIIDTDPGIDDCYAIMLATMYDNFDILGITCVAGNKSLPVVTANALRIMDFQNKDIPVHKGAKAALAKLRINETQENISADCHGSDGMGQSNLPYTDRCLKDIPAWDFLLEQVSKYPNEIEVICLGPLTNLALAVEKNVEIMKNLKSITIMGGNFYVPGNITPYAEYNIWFDADAAQEVIHALAEDVDIRIVGIDASNQVVISHGLLDFLSYEGGARGELLERISRGYIHHYYDLNQVIGVIIHDSYCMLSCIDTSLIKESKSLKINVHANDDRHGQLEICDNGKPITAILGFHNDQLKHLFLDLFMPDKKDLINQYLPQLIK